MQVFKIKFPLLLLSVFIFLVLIFPVHASPLRDNSAPVVANPIVDQAATQDLLFEFTIPEDTFLDADADELSYSAILQGGSSLPGWLGFDAGSHAFSGTPSAADVHDLQIKVTVDDGQGGEVSDVFQLSVTNVNDAPQLDLSVPDQPATEDVDFLYEFPANTFSDADADPLTYTAVKSGQEQLPDWLNFNPDTRTFTGNPPNAAVGFVDIQIVASDPAALTASDTFRITVANVNDAPHVANPIPDQITDEDSVFSFTFAANTFDDIDGDALGYSADLTDGSSLPTWLGFNAGIRTFSGTPANADVAVLQVRVTADDSNGGTVSDIFTLTVSNTNDAPTLANAIADQTTPEDSLFNFQIPANAFADVDLAVDPGEVLSYAAVIDGETVLPGWLTFTSSTRTFSGTPTNDDVGSVDLRVTVTDVAGASVSDIFRVTVSNVNDDPHVANPIPDQSATEDSAFSFTFAANAFDDVDGDALSYSADLADDSALPIWLGFNAGTRTFSGTPTNADVAVLQVRVTADDSNGGTVSDIFTLTVNNTNDVPILANAIANKSTPEDSPFSYQIPANTFNDVDPGETLSWAAELPDGNPLPAAWMSFAADTHTLTAAPENPQVGTIDIRITVTDSSSESVSDIFTLTVTNVNDAPHVASAIPDQSTAEDSAFSFTFAANAFDDIDGDVLSYSADLADDSALPIWLGFNAGTRTFSGTPANADVAVLQVRVTADDSNGGTVSDIFTLTVSNTNDAPTLANAIADQDTLEDSPFSYQIPTNTFADVDPDETFTWAADLPDDNPLPAAWMSFAADTHTLTASPENPQVGTIDIRITVTDSGGESISDTFILTVSNVNDDPHVANAIPDQSTDEDSALFFTFAANAFDDIDGDALSYNADLADDNALPTWLGFDAGTRTFSGTPANTDVAVLQVRVTADDSNSGTVSDIFTLTVRNTNDAPTLANAILDQSTPEDSSYNFQLPANTFSDVDLDVDPGEVLSYEAVIDGETVLPGWLTFTTGTRTFSGTPTNDDVGSVDIRVTVTDVAGDNVSDVFSLTVTNTNDAPHVANAIPDQTSDEDSLFTFTFAANTFADVDVGDSLSYDAKRTDNSALPVWLSFDPLTRAFSGTPDYMNTGTLSIKVIASDDNGGTVTEIFDIVISNVNDAPQVASPISDRVTAEDAFFSLQIPNSTFSDEEKDSLIYSATESGQIVLPDWLSFASETRLLSGTPDNGDVGSYQIDITVDDGNGGTVTDTFQVTVANVNDAPQLDVSLPDHTVNEDVPFSYRVPDDTFSDVDGDSLSYSFKVADDTALPSWLTVADNAGMPELSGTPANDDVGDLYVKIIATDGNGGEATDLFHIVVQNVNDVPTLETPIDDRSTDEDAEFIFVFPAATFNDIDVGDTLAYSISRPDDTALPIWLTLNSDTRTMRGTPDYDQIGDLEIKLTADDNHGGTVADTFILTINAVNDKPVVSNPISSQTATLSGSAAFR